MSSGFSRPTAPANPAQGTTMTPNPSHPRDCILVIFRALNVLTALSLILCAAAFGMAIVLRGEAKTDLRLISGQIVRVFGVAVSLSALFIEAEWTFVLKKLAPVLELWFARGLLYLFIASLTFREAYPAEDVSDFEKSLQLYRLVSFLALASCSMVYIVGGVLCLGVIKRLREKREERILEAESEYEELERRRRELQRLLGRQTAEP